MPIPFVSCFFPSCEDVSDTGVVAMEFEEASDGFACVDVDDVGD